MLLKPHFAPKGTTMTAAYYCSMLQSDTLRQIATCVPEGEQFYFQQDLASSHTAKQTMKMLEDEGVALAPWMPAGADLNPLDIYVKPELKKRLHRKDLSTVAKLLSVTARELDSMSKDADFLAGLQKCCRSFKKRAKWVAENDGRKVSHALLARAEERDGPNGGG